MQHKRVTTEILRAFELYKKEHGIPSDYVLCKKLEIPRATFSGWKNGRSKSIQRDIWAKIKDLLDPFLNQVKKRVEQEEQFMFEEFLDMYKRAEQCRNRKKLIKALISSMDKVIALSEEM